MRFLCLTAVLLCLPSCAWWQAQSSSQEAPWHNPHYVSRSIYARFPEAPHSHVFVSYDLMELYQREELSLLSLSFYLPSVQLEQLGEPLRIEQKIRQLFQDWHQPDLECLQVSFSKQTHYFAGISQPLKQVTAEFACG